MKLAALALLSACHIAFGLEHQDPPPDAPPGPLPPIQGSVVAIDVLNDATLQPIQSSHHFTTFELVIFSILRDGEAVPVEYHPDTGAFEVARSSELMRIQLRFGTVVHEYQWDLPALSISEIGIGRGGGPQATSATMLKGTITGTLPSWVTTVYVTNARQQVNPTFDATGFHTSWTGQLASTALNDQMIFVGYDRTAQNAIILDQVTPVAGIEMTTGINDLGKFPLMPAPKTGCVHAVTDLAADAARLEAVYPSFGTATAKNIDVFSAPAAALAPTVPWLLSQGPSGIGDTMLDYSNVFPGTTSLVSAAVTRVTTLPDGLPIAVAAISFEMPSTTCAAPMPLTPLDVAIPGGFVVSNVPLDHDGVSIVLPMTFLLTWQPNGRADLYQIAMYDVTGATVPVPHVFYTRSPSVTLDGGDFVTGHRYVFVVVADVGLPDAAAGDLTTRAYPSQTGTGVSPILIAL